MSFNAHDVRWFSELVMQLHVSTAEAALFDALLPALHQRFRSLASVVEEASYNLSTFRLHGICGDVRPPANYVAALGDSPCVASWQTRQPNETLHLTRLSPRSAFHRTTFYNSVCRTMNLNHQLIGTFRAAPGVGFNFSVNGDRPYSEDEHKLMEHVRRHVRACVVRLRRSKHDFPVLPCPEIHLGPDHRPIELTDSLRRLLGRYFPTGRRSIAEGRLPDELARWIVASVRMLSERPPPRPLRYLRVDGPGGHLVFRFFPSGSRGSAMLRVTEELLMPNVGEFRKAGRLTVRECDILHWLMAGKRDREIGVILGCSSRTVSTHVAAILRKTGVSNRQAAVYVARQRLAGAGRF
ncbi:MAG: helix-turn-helix transcriptional regulator [Opitutaceae bacterium]